MAKKKLTNQVDLDFLNGNEDNILKSPFVLIYGCILSRPCFRVFYEMFMFC